MIRVNVGDLKQVIEIQEFTSGSDDSGFVQEEWKTIATPRASISYDDKLLREQFEMDGRTSVQVFQFTFRYFPNLTTKHRIIYKGRTFEIFGVNNLEEANRFYKAYCREICL